MSTNTACNHEKRPPSRPSLVPKYQNVTTPESDVPQLDARDLKIARLIFAGELTTDEIGREVGLSGAMIRMIRAGTRIPAIAQFIETLCREAVEQDRVTMLRSQRRAGQVLAELLESSDARVRLDAARAIRQELRGMKLTVENRGVTPADAARMFAERFHTTAGKLNGSRE